MLILNRKEGERIIIKDDIIITLVRSWNGTSKIGIEAPKDVEVHREEVHEAIKRNGMKRKE